MPRRKGVPPKRDIRRTKGRPSEYKPEYPEMLKAHMAGGESFPTFAAVIGHHWDTLYDWCDPDSPRYQPEFSEARKVGEALLLRFDERIGTAGMTGQLKRVVSETIDPEGTKRVEYAPASFAAAIWIFRMKNRFPTIYRDRIETALTDPDGKPLAAAPTQVILQIPSNGSEAKGSRDDEG